MNTAKSPTLDTDFNQKYQLLAKIGSGDGVALAGLTPGHRPGMDLGRVADVDEATSGINDRQPAVDQALNPTHGRRDAVIVRTPHAGRAEGDHGNASLIGQTPGGFLRAGLG